MLDAFDFVDAAITPVVVPLTAGFISE